MSWLNNKSLNWDKLKRYGGIAVTNGCAAIIRTESSQFSFSSSLRIPQARPYKRYEILMSVSTFYTH
jgi:hypothetical protein